MGGLWFMVAWRCGFGMGDRWAMLGVLRIFGDFRIFSFQNPATVSHVPAESHAHDHDNIDHCCQT